MIGPKQFDIRHKTKPYRDFDNPIVNKIFAPMFKYREDDLDDIIGEFESDLKDRVEVFLDKFKAPMFAEKQEDISPENREHPKKRTRNKISEDTINQITYKVFQNIKEYLDKDKTSMGRNKGIKLEIDF